MNYKDKIIERLINKSAGLHQRIEGFKAIETKHNRAEFVSNAFFVDRRRSVFIRDNNNGSKD